MSAHDFPKGIGMPATRALIAAGYTQVAQLVFVREADLLRLHGVGPKAIAVLRDTLHSKGQSFAAHDQVPQVNPSNVEEL